MSLLKLLMASAGTGAEEMKYHFALFDWGWSYSQYGLPQVRWFEQWDTDNYIMTVQGSNAGSNSFGLWTYKADIDGFPTWTKAHQDFSQPSILHNQAMKNPIYSGYDIATNSFGSDMQWNRLLGIPESGRLGTSSTLALAGQNNFTGPNASYSNNAIVKLTHPDLTDYVVCGSYDDGSVNAGYISKYNSSNVLQWTRLIKRSGNTVRFYEARLLSDGSVIFLTDEGHGKFNSSGTLSWAIARVHISSADKVLFHVDSTETYAYVSDGDTVVSRINISTGTPGQANHNLSGPSNTSQYISGDKTQGMSIDTDQNLWVTRKYSNMVAKFTASGTFLGKYTITSNKADSVRVNGVFCDDSDVWIYGACGWGSGIVVAPFIAKLPLDGSTTFTSSKFPAAELITNGDIEITLAWSTSGTDMTWQNISPDPESFNVSNSTWNPVSSAATAGLFTTPTANIEDPYRMLS